MHKLVAVCIGRLRPIASVWVGLILGVMLNGCGGGSTAANPPSGPDTGPTHLTCADSSRSAVGPESPFLLADYVVQDPAHAYVRVWDPAHPDVAVELACLATGQEGWSTFSGIGSQVLSYSDATRFDGTSGLLTTLGHARVFYTFGGRVFTIDLRGGQSHRPVALSNVSAAGFIQSVVTLNADGDQAWIVAGGADQGWAISTAMTAGQAPLQFNPYAKVSVLPDAASGLPQYLFAEMGPQGSYVSTVLDTGFNPVPVPAVAAMGAGDYLVGLDPAHAGIAYLHVGQALQALRWSREGVSVDVDSVYTFTNPSGLHASTSDAKALFFNDGPLVKQLTDGQVSALADMGVDMLSGGNVQHLALWDAGESLVVRIDIALVPACCTEDLVISKASGTITSVDLAGMGDTIIGASGAGILVQQNAAINWEPYGPGRSGPTSRYALFSVTGAKIHSYSGQAVAPVLSATHRPGADPSPVAVVVCTEKADATSGCAPGPITQVDLATGATTPMGSISVASSWTDGALVAGLPGVLGLDTLVLQAPVPWAFTARDSLQVFAGTSGSLQAVTGYLR